MAELFLTLGYIGAIFYIGLSAWHLLMVLVSKKKPKHATFENTVFYAGVILLLAYAIALVNVPFIIFFGGLLVMALLSQCYQAVKKKQKKSARKSAKKAPKKKRRK